MDDLDKQLAELQMLNNQELKPSPHGGGTLGKKIGPAVPPKPAKKNQPQVPISCTVKAACEPSYSTRLQTTNNPPNLYSNVPQDAVAMNASSSSSSSYGKNMNDHVTYSNVQVGPGRNHSDKLIYSNLVHHQQPPPPVSRDVNFYSNLPSIGGNNMYANGGAMEDLPPPPLDLAPGDYAPCTVNTNFPPPPEDLPPPPSPVSSSYSELRRATDTEYPMHQEYGTLGSQASSTYESIYEPINPRPPSQMSSRSNYSLYAPYVSGTSASTQNQSVSRMGGVKEAEVDALTDLLVHSMGGGDEPDCYGVCYRCQEKVIGENSGCTAMEQIYHTACFTCHNCAINLQGKPFYALENKPFCEEDYLNTLEKCSVCMKPILDRILRATGKPYHPKCFTCVLCGKSLDGIPFTVDATNQIHCIEDFHKKFAPRCCVCKLPIMPEPGQDETVRVVALDRSFHIPCYKCEDCGLVLSSEAEGRGCYPLDDHVLCKSCNAKRVQALTSHMTTDL